MSTSPVGGATSQTSLGDALGSTQKLGQQQFLQLLVTQMTNQDPLSPQDDQSFLAEMAQFSAVDAMSGVSSSVGQLQAAALIGKTVTASISSDSGVQPVTGVVSSVLFGADGTKLTVGDQTVDLSSVTTVQ